MNKKLVAMAVGAALGSAPMLASQAKVTLYGHLQVEIGNMDVGGTTGDSNFTTDQNRGRLGVKASEKLGNGMTAIAKFEWKVDTTVANVAAGNRESFVGLKGSFGTVTVGANKQPYKYMGGVKYDPFVATTLEARNNGGMSGNDLDGKSYGHNSFMSNSIAWKSPNYSGMTIWAVYSVDEENHANGGDGDYSLGLRYKNGPMEIGVAATNNDDANSTIGGDGWKVFGKYKFGNHTITAQFEQLDDNTASTDVDYWFVGWQMKAGSNTFVAQVGNRDEAGAEWDYYTIGMIHHLSKKTRLFGGYRNTDKGTAGETEVLSIGMRMIF